MARVLHFTNSVPSKINAIWPVLIQAGKKAIEAESRIVTGEGLLIKTEQQLPRNENLHIMIMPKPRVRVDVRGKLIFSNPNRTYSKTTFSSEGFSFVKVSKEDRYLLQKLILHAEKTTIETVEKVKMKVEIETNKRTLRKDFSNLHDLRQFMQNFFALPQVADRRTDSSMLRYKGREKRTIG
jgi:hypothetical protein